MFTQYLLLPDKAVLLGPNFFERTLEKISIRSLPFGSAALVGDRDRGQTVNALDSRTLVEGKEHDSHNT